MGVFSGPISGAGSASQPIDVDAQLPLLRWMIFTGLTLFRSSTDVAIRLVQSDACVGSDLYFKRHFVSIRLRVFALPLANGCDIA